MITLGFLELNSIAKGIEAADAILKAADTQLVMNGPCCPGKYIILFSGEVSAVQSALDVANRVSPRCIVDQTVIARVHPQVMTAISQATAPSSHGAIGVMEFFSVTAAIYAADAAAKAADVELIDVRLGTGIGGKSFVVLTGEVSACQEAVNCGISAAAQAGLVIEHVVIANPRPEIFSSLL